MKKFVFYFSFFVILITSLAQAQDPLYYSKKATWQATMLSSIEKLREYNSKSAIENNFTLSDWKAIGPFQKTGENVFYVAFEPEKEILFDKTYNDGKLKWENRPEWKDSKTNLFKESDNSAMYLYRTITSKIDTSITIYLGSDDGIKVWINEKLVLENDASRGCEPNQEIINIKLIKGENKFFMKINNGGGPWGFYFSLYDVSPLTLLWNLTERDFADPKIHEEIYWEKEDLIWDEKADIPRLGENYINAYKRSCEFINSNFEETPSGVKTFSDLKSIRDKYINSRKAEKIVLTPKPPATPRINGSKVFGVRPGHPFQFTIPATGDRPMEFSVANLPKGLQVDKKTGVITGILDTKKEYNVVLIAKNSLGIDKKKFKIVVGDQIALTPPLGWNSWNCFANAVDDGKVRSAADAMVNSGLINHGWTYINIDDCWEIKPGSKDPLLMGEPRDKNGMINTNKKFPNMKALGDYIHSKGLKMGIYSSPGELTCANFTASYKFEKQDAQSYADWGIDYLKYDWCSYWDIEKNPKLPEFKKPYFVMRDALNKVNRDIVYSLCQYGMGKVWEWGDEVGGNCWRTTGDIVDTWESMSGIGFSQDGHEKFAKPGNWNDPDMLVVGYVGWGPRLHPTRLRPNEQYTHISLWCLLSSPLLIGCDMTRFDDFTLSLLTNDEVLAINQDPLGKPAGRIKKDGDIEIWARDLEDGSKAVGIFNLGLKKLPATLKLSDLGLKGKHMVRDLWRQQDISTIENEFNTTVTAHGVVLVKLTSAK
jgi:alpha-galactosidase